MLHARIAARAFNTPLLVEPSKAMAFLSGLGPSILGRRVELVDGDATPDGTAALPARASILAGGLAESFHLHGDAPYPVVDGIAVIEIAGVLIHRGGWIGQSSGQTSYEGIAAQIEAAASDPAVRGLALEIDSFGGEVAGVFDLADRIRAIRGAKPVWAFVAEHAFSAGYALASQADRILLPRTGALGSIGVVVLHADLSGQLDQDGVRVTLIHSGSHKVEGNPYQPLPEAVRDDIQREIDLLRFLFAETVAAGRSGRLSQEAALATEAATFRGADAVAAGLADEVTDLARGFAAFRQMLAQRPPAAIARMAPSTRNDAITPRTRKETTMSNAPDQDETLQEDVSDAQPDDAADAVVETPACDAPETAAAPESPSEPAPAPASSQRAASPQPSNLAELSAQLREAAAEIAEIAAQAGRLGIAIDAAKALREGTTPEALRKLVLQRAADASDARDVIAAAPSPILPKSSESPIVTAAKRAAANPRG
ncbi:S49 family peptidase [Roseinatronobacter bogoriensis]|uniref:Serine peptidase n=1 Tax=Roseinatronobacter bogoriensis subsp. barguzinensis TaxID=441209 RepID=A0A2K8K560_9RHOB|nr:MULTISPECIES: S49 family peptidase [Rhodobaca]ATX64592.1 serine peptidase [Rhodobaca barguzinensis]MBB4209825.1 signal peptide peptidase SppA [Rhodobaca bogoriensis DSM 18756]TDW33137.1 signal peptide peptidase SppA [Rhodobaca barguzinensis]TDY65967.1 protein C [Rhodobaca bogoriensis DSM 18756]